MRYATTAFAVFSVSLACLFALLAVNLPTSKLFYACIACEWAVGATCAAFVAGMEWGEWMYADR